jgi:uncharacterized protein
MKEPLPEAAMENERNDEVEKLERMRREEAKTWSMMCHLSVFAGFIVPFGNIFGPLTVWLMKRDSIAEVREHGREALNFQLSITIYSIVLTVAFFAGMLGAAMERSPALMIVAIGITIVALSLFSLVCIIIATVRASRGETFIYPLSIRFIS